MNLKNKVALIIGGTGGIGQATAIAFAQAGADIIIAGRNETAAEGVLNTIKDIGNRGLFIKADVTDSKAIETLIDTAANEFGRIDCAFNNAGWEGTAAKSADIEEADWLKMMDIKLNGLWRSMKFQIRLMQKQDGGSIVNMAGNWGLIGYPQYASYCAAAHGVMGLTRAAAKEYAGDNIRINAICPGAVDAPMLDRMVGGDEKAKTAIGRQLAMGRIARPEEVARTVLWLSSEDTSYITGQGIVMDGGG